MGEADQAVVDQPGRTLGVEGGGDVDHMDVVEARGELLEHQVQPPEAVAMAVQAPVRQTEGLNRRLRQVVDQDRLGGVRAQALDDVTGLVQIDRRRIAAVVGGRTHGHQPPRAQGADQDRLVGPFRGQAQIVGEAGRHLDLDAARGGLAAQEVALHL